MSNGTVTWSYTYNADGLRIKRTNGTTTYSYVYLGGELERLTVGSEKLAFAYDAGGTPLTVRWNGTYYFYLTNLQGDVIAITDETGTIVVQYTYDSWGNPLTTTGTLATTLGALNPLRYRGYVYDQETGLYYLQSRYYNPEIGRFINGDTFFATGQGLLGNNMFAYCGNNPIMRVDPTGTCYYNANGEWCHDNWEYLDGHERSSNPQGEGSTLRDVTEEILIKLTLEIVSVAIKKCSTLSRITARGSLYLDFYTKVNHNAKWDIKREGVWEETIGTDYPGWDTHVLFDGIVMTPENLGNFTYGFVGSVYGIPINVLLLGSYYAAGCPESGDALANEMSDWYYIRLGYQYANNGGL